MHARHTAAGMLFGLALAASSPLAAQAPADSTAAPDSLGGFADVPLVVPPEALAPFDSSALPSSSGALRRALLLPGWGQVYVGQPAKAPFAAAGVVGLTGLTVYLHTRYRLYQRATIYADCTEDPTLESCADSGFQEYEDEWGETGSRAASTTRTLRDDLRRNRDLAGIGTFVVYALQALDAYVAAQLVGFDVSEDLSLRVVPGRDGPAALLVVRL